MKRCVAIVSGGIDSITLYYYLKNKEYNVDILSFDYGAKHNAKELPMIEKHIIKCEDTHIIIPLEFINEHFNSSLLKSGEDIPEGHYEDENMKSTVVPFRNGIMLSIAIGYAESKGISKVFLGSHAGDHAIYPDCRSIFTKAMSMAGTLGTYNEVQVVSPFNDLTKADIVSIGYGLNIKYENTWSCYKGKNVHCGVCGTCVERKEAFALSNLKDPTVYAEVKEVT